MVKRIEYVCKTCRVPFSVWWASGMNDPPKVACPICLSTNVLKEGEYDYSRRG